MLLTQLCCTNYFANVKLHVDNIRICDYLIDTSIDHITYSPFIHLEFRNSISTLVDSINLSLKHPTKKFLKNFVLLQYMLNIYTRTSFEWLNSFILTNKIICTSNLQVYHDMYPMLK